jgi:hypothetical protein
MLSVAFFGCTSEPADEASSLQAQFQQMKPRQNRHGLR